jgi:hypothetical protein
LAHAKFPLNSWVAEARRYLDIHEDTPAANTAISCVSDGLAPWVAAIEEWRQLTEVCRQPKPTEREIVCEGFRPDDELQELLKNRVSPPTPQRRALATATGDEDLSPRALCPKRSQLGFYVLRQRGGEPSAAQMTSVTSAVKELFSVVGDLSALFEADGLRFVHSEGRLPFGWVWYLGRKKTHALYRPVTNLIAIGAEGDPLPALAHEWGHWLDYRALDTNLTACSCYGLPEMHTLLVRAAGSMDQVFELLPHEMCPTEIWARLVAQYVYRELCAMKGLRPAFLCAGERYASGAGYWSEGAWQELQPGVVEAIQGRLSDMAGRLSVSLERSVVLWQG